MEFPRKEYWSGLPFFPPRDPPHPGVEPVSPALASGFFTAAPPGKAIQGFYITLYCNKFIILFTQYFPTVKYLERRYSSTVEWLAFLSSTNYITAAFTLASGHPGLEIKILYYCTL